MGRFFSRVISMVIFTCLVLDLFGCQTRQVPLSGVVTYRRLVVQEYRKKMMAGWIGQMNGVSYGSSTEFHYRGQIIPQAETPAYQQGMVNWAFGQDDLYVEMTFLRTLEVYGLDASSKQAGLDFANSEYPLWHANSAGRMNLRSGVAPPDSGHPAFNPHTDDIDYQIESDFAGLISPGLPNQAITLGETFGRLMNYGDGLYGGQFMSCLYSEAFFETNPEKLVEAGLACIPAKSQYAEAVSDVLNWWRQDPQDWQATWQKINAKYQENPAYRRFSCSDPYFDNQFNIDAKINGAYVVLGLLYGGGDPLKSMTIAMRSGQDSDCNPASAGGVIFTTLGLDSLPDQFTAGLDNHKKWDYTEYNFTRLIDVCEKLARQAVLKAGGKIETNAEGQEEFVIPQQKPLPGALEQSWEPGPIQNSTYTEAELDSLRGGGFQLARQVGKFAPGWRVTSCMDDFLLGMKEDASGRPRVLLLRGGDWMPCTLSTEVDLPAGVESVLRLEAGVVNGAPWTLLVRSGGQELLRQEISPATTHAGWLALEVDLAQFSGKRLRLEVSDQASGESTGYGFLSELSIQQRKK